MEFEQMNEEIYKKGLDNLFSKFPVFNIENYFDSFYEEKIPNSLKKYFEPERRYFKKLARELNPYFDKIRNNLHESLREDPKKAMNTKLEDLLFSSKYFKKQLGEKIEETIEESAYVLEVAAVDLYNIWDIKINLPIIGKIIKKKLKNETGEEDLPSFDNLKKEIEKIKLQGKSLLDYLDLSYNISFSKEEIRREYHRRMRNMGCVDKEFLEYDYNEKNHIPLNAKESEDKFKQKVRKEYFDLKREKRGEMIDDYLKIRKKQRQKKFIKSDYNSFGEKLLCYLGLFFNWFFEK